MKSPFFWVYCPIRLVGFGRALLLEILQMVRRLPIFRPCRVILPPSAVASFVRDMRAFLAESNDSKRDEIAARQLDVLEKFRLPQERDLRLSDVKEMFLQMRDHV
jgi:hypothetical protein